MLYYCILRQLLDSIEGRTYPLGSNLTKDSVTQSCCLTGHSVKWNTTFAMLRVSATTSRLFKA